MYLKFLACALRLALTRRFDAIHGGRALPEGLVAWLVARLSFRPVVIYAHGEELTGWGRGNKYKAMCFALRHADRVIANSDFTRDTLVGMGVRPERIVLIHPGVDHERFRPGLPADDLRASLGLDDSARLILSVGRLSRRKGFDTLIRSLPALRAHGFDVHLAIVGIGEDADYLDGVAKEAGVVDRVHRLGHVPMEDLPRWYNACDVFVLANREIGGDTEGFGMVFIEAAACGKAAIAGRAGGTGSAVLDGVTGLRVDASAEAELVAALARLLGDPSLLESMGQAGLARVRQSLSWQAVAERTRNCLRG
jgi:phosphatidylinositol alpha-1,6-mannosyltransferase